LNVGFLNVCALAGFYRNPTKIGRTLTDKNRRTERRQGELSLWRFAIDLYGRAGVQVACLELQDRHRLDVDMVLAALWAGATVDHDSWQRIDRRVAPWRNDVIHVLRAARRDMKVTEAQPSRSVKRETIKMAELDGERREIEMLEALISATVGRGVPTNRCAWNNLMAYARLNIDPVPPNMMSLLRGIHLAAFPDPEQAVIVETTDTAPRNLPMNKPTVSFETPSDGTLSMVVDQLVIGGWTGRDAEALQHHIDELAELGVPGPSETPLYYRCATDQTLQRDSIQVLGRDSSGEVEAVLVSTDKGLFVTTGSDHTDRKVEAYSIAVSKQMCPKVLAGEAWPFAEVEAHWDQLILRAHQVIDGERVLYQEGPMAGVRQPREIISKYTDGADLPSGTILLLGTVPAIGGIRHGDRFEMELIDPVLDRRIVHAYDIDSLPIVS
jgi:uncharacterized protein (TIGR02444 family)